MQKFVNNARSLLNSLALVGATSMVLETGTGDLFPVANMGTGSSGDWFWLTLENDLGQCEIIKVRTRASGSDVISDLLRAQQGTTAMEWPAGSVIGLRLTATDIEYGLCQDWSYLPEHTITSSAGVKTLEVGASGDMVFTETSNLLIPAGVFGRGQIVVLYNDDTANHTVTPDTGVTLKWEDGETGVRTLLPDAMVTLVCLGSDTFRIAGPGIE